MARYGERKYGTFHYGDTRIQRLTNAVRWRVGRLAMVVRVRS